MFRTACVQQHIGAGAECEKRFTSAVNRHQEWVDGSQCWANLPTDDEPGRAVEETALAALLARGGAGASRLTCPWSREMTPEHPRVGEMKSVRTKAAAADPGSRRERLAGDAGMHPVPRSSAAKPLPSFADGLMLRVKELISGSHTDHRRERRWREPT